MEIFNTKKVVSDIVVNVNEVSRIADGAILKGDLSSRNDIRLDGSVDGTIYSQGKIVVGETARLKGAMFCANTDFRGRMEGDLYVSDILNLKSTAKVNGNIHVHRLLVEIGAEINCMCRMITQEEFDKECSTVVKAKLPGNAASPAPAAAPAKK